MTSMTSRLQKDGAESLDVVDEKGTSLWSDAWRKLKKNKMALVALFYMVAIIGIAIFAPYIAPYSYEETDLILGPTPPSAAHWFGTDELGRDLLTRVMFGGRISLAVGFLATSVIVVVGVIYGAVAGYMGGKVDSLMMRFVDLLQVLPYIIIVIILMVFLGRNILNLFIAIGLIEWLTMARIVRGQVISLKKMEFVEAAKASGLSTPKIIFKHIMPNTVSSVIIYSTLSIPSVILSEAFLSFIGLGVQAPMASWGTLIQDGVGAMEVYPWMIIFPCITLVMTLLFLNFLGDGLRDALDPKASKD